MKSTIWVATKDLRDNVTFECEILGNYLTGITQKRQIANMKLAQVKVILPLFEE